ncbi:polyketide synthase [Aspergillus ibericus CBS 121593]|uniref:Polyketide synthase n=1 Tax=Aspergillus ibericus CBS 121593 TaxID=1448316 RepID=A0A395GYL4_9EURO|nr:polyketide synthase [Aspergillus ibericus CBS 121593]RAL00155.1 polyketide synthase [Aspergillus ibericus CBS 121593]
MAIDNGSEHVVEAAIHIENVGEEPHRGQPTSAPWGNNNGQQDGRPPAIAIVGMGMRFPGNIRTAEDFWSLLVEKKSAVGEIPPGRYHGDSFYHPSRPHVVKTKHGYFLQEEYLGKVDPGFVGRPHEAGLLDPQQRILLEVVWECMENAGQSDWRGHDIGCFVGTFGEDWLEVTSKDFQAIDRFRAMGTGDFALANRISFEFDLKGPSITYKTACSSSLVALHEACQAIHSGDCSSAIVGGSSIIFSPTMSITMSDSLVLAPDGRCKTFDASADGYGRGEGVNAIYIKPLDAAIRDGDPIRAIIRSTATNSDGKTPNISTPDRQSQEILIRRAYSRAGISDPCQTALFECHGTGTTMGDVTETEAVARIFGEKGILIGAVKPNVGHMEGASGLTSVIKAVLSLENRKIPPNIYFERPNPEIPFKEGKLEVPIDTLPWPEDREARVSVNSFGIGGANAHVILDAFKRRAPMPISSHDGSSNQLLVVSAWSGNGLDQKIQQLQSYLDQHPESFNDVAYTLGSRRDHLAHRAFMITDGKTGILEGFQRTFLPESQRSELIFAFTGQGAQWPGMAKGLIERYPQFYRDVQAMDETLRGLPMPPKWSLHDTLMEGNQNTMDRAECSQPLCTAIQLAIINILASYNISPSKVIGHSSGEIAAAYASGAISMETAIILAYYRGQVSSQCEGKGAMLAVGLSPKQVRSYITGGVVVACYNSPESVTLSGDSDSLDEVAARIRADVPDTLMKKLPVQVAYHSSHMMFAAAHYEELIRPHITCRPNMLARMFSTMTGQVIHTPSQLDAGYWRANLESPVQFTAAMGAALKSAADTPQPLVLEIGPHSALSGPIRQISKDIEKLHSYCPTVVRGDDSTSTFLDAVGQAYLHGAPVRFTAVNGTGSCLNDLLPYPWQYENLGWSETRPPRQWRLRKFPHHELLGSRTLESSDMEPCWRNVFRLDEAPWIWDHSVAGQIVFPCAGYIAMVTEAARQVTASDSITLRNLLIRTALIVEPSLEYELLTSIRPVAVNDLVESSWYDFTVYSYDGTSWKKHCAGQVKSGTPSTLLQPPGIPVYPRAVSSSYLYRQLKKAGLKYGKNFQGLKDITASPSTYEAAATVQDDLQLHGGRYLIHPTVIDQCLQLHCVAACRGLTPGMGVVGVPSYIGEVYITHSSETMSLGVGPTVSKAITDVLGGDARLIRSDGTIALSMRDARFFALENDGKVRQEPFLCSYMKCQPDIRLNPAKGSVKRAAVDTGLEVTARLAVLAILDYDILVRDLTPTVPHMVKYQQWIKSEALQIRTTDYHGIGEARQWAQISSGERLDLWNTLLDKVADVRLSGFFADARSCLASEMDSLMTGKSSAAQLLTSRDSWKDLYAYAVDIVDWHRFFELLGHSSPQLRILEIGAGTGSATAGALRALVDYRGDRSFSRYVVTDITPGFLIPLQEQHGSQLEYAVLDISLPPADQGFDVSSFDLVIASNVIHATPSLNKTLSNVKTLLRPGGWLMLHELSAAVPYVDWVMGTLPGWWLGEADQRLGRPYVTVERWNDELVKAGFTEIEDVAYDEDFPFQMSATMIARSVPTKPPVPVVSLLGTRETQQHPWAGVIEKKLCDQGYTIQWCMLGECPKESFVISLLDLDGPFLYDLPEVPFSQLRNYLSIGRQTLWITRLSQKSCQDPRYGLIHGFSRTIRAETGIDFRTVEVDEFNDTTADVLMRVCRDCLDEKANPSGKDFEYSIEDGQVYTSRCSRLTMEEQLGVSGNDGPLRLHPETRGVLDTLQWVEEEEQKTLQPNEVEVDMKYLSLNFKDLMFALGLLGNHLPLGIEGSGVVRRVGSAVGDLHEGEAVIIIQQGTFKTRLVTRDLNCMRIPDGISLEQASAMPCVYATAIYSLLTLGNLKKGQSVLIHAACGGVGLAAIDICRMVGAEVYATVSSEEKIRFLIQTFNIPRERIFDSRSVSFRGGVLDATDGRGVDLVLNSLAGELLHASWDCVAPMGKMIEIGKRDMLEHGKLEMVHFANNRSFFGVDLSEMLEDCPELVRGSINEMFIYCQDGRLQARLFPRMFEASDIAAAFRHMQTGRHIGKIVVKMPEDPHSLKNKPIERKYVFSPTRSYLLVGGFGGIGRLLATWMVTQGTRHLVIMSRSAGQSDSDQNYIKELESQGCTVTVVHGSVEDPSSVEQAVSASEHELAGVVNLSLVLQDEFFANMSYTQWLAPLGSKVRGAWNLHNACSEKQLDFFVLFSSVVGTSGNPGQSSYGAANTFVDSFVTYRRTQGLPASRVTLGAVEEVGNFSRNTRLLELFHAQSRFSLSEKDVIDSFRLALPHTISSSTQAPHPLDIMVGVTSFLNPDELSTTKTHFDQDVRFNIPSLMRPTKGPEHNQEDDVLLRLFESIANDPSFLNDPKCESTIIRELGKRVGNFSAQAGLDEKQIASFPIDSLMGLEVKYWIRRSLDLETSVLEIAQAKTVAGVAGLAMKGLRAKYGIGAPETATAAANAS